MIQYINVNLSDSVVQRGNEKDTGPTAHFSVSRSEMLVLLPRALTFKADVRESWGGGGRQKAIDVYV